MADESTSGILDALKKDLSDTSQKISEFIGQNEKLKSSIKSIKNIGGTVGHGVMGPGWAAYDLANAAKGEKSLKSMAVELEKTKLKGEAVARTFESFGKAFNFEKIGAGLADFTRTMTSWSHMMGSSIDGLSTKTGMLARSFSTMASGIKVMTGPLLTTLVATNIAYDQFVDKWMKSSEKLEASIKSTAATFKSTQSSMSLRGGTDRFVESGMGTRQQFLEMMKGMNVYGGKVSVEQGSQIIESSRMLAQQLGKNQQEMLDKLIQHFNMMSVTQPDQVSQAITRQRLALGPNERVRGFGSRYQQFSEDAGRFYGSVGKQMPNSLWQESTFSMVGDPIGKFKQSVVKDINSAIDAVLTPISFIGKGATEAGRLLSKGAIYTNAQMARSNLGIYEGKNTVDRYGFPISVTGGSYTDEERKMAGVKGVTQGFRVMGGELEHRVAYEQERLTSEEKLIAESRRRVDVSKALGGSETKKYIEEAQRILKMREAPGAFDSLKNVKEMNEAISNLEKMSGIDLRKILETVEISNKNQDVKILSGQALDKYEKVLLAQEKVRDEKIELIREQQKLKISAYGKGQLPETSLQLLQASQMPVGTAERQVRESYIKLTQATKDVARLEAQRKEGGLRTGEIEELNKAKQTYETEMQRQTGLTVEQRKEHQRLQNLVKREKDPKKRALLEERARKYYDGVYKGSPISIMHDIAEQGRNKWEAERPGLALEQGRLDIQSTAKTLHAQGILSNDQLKAFMGYKDDKGEQVPGLTDKDTFGSVAAEQGKWKLEEAMREQQRKNAAVDLPFVEKHRQLQGFQASLQSRHLAMGGNMSEEKRKQLLDALATGRPEGVRQAQNIVQEAQQWKDYKIGEVDYQYAKPTRELQKGGYVAHAQELASRGMMGEDDVKKIQKLIKKGDDESLRHAENMIKLTEQRIQLEEKILSTKLSVIKREGERAGVARGIERLEEEGIAGPETAAMKKITTKGSSREFDTTKESMNNIIRIREDMYKKEIQFTIAYGQARANVIKAHYDSMNMLEKAKLEQMDRKYAPHIQYGQGVYGAQQTMVNAAMGRYEGEDYWRGQGREERGLKESRTNLLFQAGGAQIPREVQLMRAFRQQREAEEDFKRRQARQKEHDIRSIGAVENTWGATQAAVADTGGDWNEFAQSEGARQLKLQLLQQNQAAYSRRGQDVSPKIIELAGEQQKFQGRKLVAEMRIRQNDTESIEGQIQERRAAIEDSSLDEKGKQKAGVSLAETYQEAAKHYASIGDVKKSSEYSKLQKEELAKIPPEMKKDFGNYQKQMRDELKTHTGQFKEEIEWLQGIAKAVGGEKGGDDEKKKEEGKDKEAMAKNEPKTIIEVLKAVYDEGALRVKMVKDEPKRDEPKEGEGTGVTDSPDQQGTGGESEKDSSPDKIATAAEKILQGGTAIERALSKGFSVYVNGQQITSTGGSDYGV